MRAASQFGLLLGVVVTPMMLFGPKPLAPLVAGALLAGPLLVAGVLTWRRTGLRIAAAAMFTGAIGAAVLALVHARFPGLRSAPSFQPAALLCLALLAPALLLLQARRAPEAWQRWRDHTESVTLVEMLRFRHIPDLRGARSDPGAERARPARH